MVLCITANSNTICVCIRRSSSEAVRHCFCKARLFRVFLTASCLHTWRNCESLSWVMRVCRSQGPRGDPITPTTGEASTCVGQFPEWPGLERNSACAAFQQASKLAPLWLRRGLSVGEEEGVVGRALQCFQKHRFLAAPLRTMGKNACC